MCVCESWQWPEALCGTKGIVLWSAYAIKFDFRHCLCSRGKKTTTKQETLAHSAGLAEFPFIAVMKVSLRAEAATRPRWTVLVTEEEPRVKSGTIQYESKVLQLGLSERSKDRWWIHNKHTHTSSKGSMTGPSMGVVCDTHTHTVHTY